MTSESLDELAFYILTFMNEHSCDEIRGDMCAASADVPAPEKLPDETAVGLDAPAALADPGKRGRRLHSRPPSYHGNYSLRNSTIAWAKRVTPNAIFVMGSIGLLLAAVMAVVGIRKRWSAAERKACSVVRPQY